MNPENATEIVPSVWHHLAGPTGGIMATCLLAGIGIGWKACQRMIVSRLEAENQKRVAELQTRIDALWEKVMLFVSDSRDATRPTPPQNPPESQREKDPVLPEDVFPDLDS